MRLGVDTGGTFTDFVLLRGEGADAELQTHKVLSTPDAPERAILQGIAEMGLLEAVARGEVSIVHGSTVATNAALEGKGVATAYITNRGFADVLAIARQTRPRLYHLQQPRVPAPVPPELCLETGGRVSATGELIEPLSDEDIREVIEKLERLRPRAVAINFLFSFLDAGSERRLSNALREALPWLDCICHSAAVLPEYREYERGMATWLNAALGPHMAGYLKTLGQETAPAPLAIMQSSGGTIAADQAADNAVRLLLSGPAGGLAAVQWLSSLCGEDKFMTFDMGGTSTDVALFDGGIRLTSEGALGNWPVAVPMVDMHTIGAGGGSIAWLDEGGLLQVGPQSAGASPGPACYGAGGTHATVTDANLLLGNLPADLGLAGSLRPDLEAAKRVIQDLAEKSALTDKELAEGILRIANEHMAQALRVISLARGHDPREFRLCCFGGAGGLHVCALAQELGMRHALVPAHAGVFSALGMLAAPASRQLSRSIQCTLDALDLPALRQQIEQLRHEARRQLLAEGHKEASIHYHCSADLRYQGQSSALNVPWSDPEPAGGAFAAMHEALYRFSLDAPVELVNIRLAARVESGLPTLPELEHGTSATPAGHTHIAGIDLPVPIFQRAALVRDQQLRGPALIVESSATTLVAAGWSAKVDAFGNLWLEFG